VRKKSITNSEPFVKKMKKCQVTWGGDFLTHTVYCRLHSVVRPSVCHMLAVHSRVSVMLLLPSLINTTQ